MKISQILGERLTKNYLLKKGARLTAFDAKTQISPVKGNSEWNVQEIGVGR